MSLLWDQSNFSKAAWIGSCFDYQSSLRSVLPSLTGDKGDRPFGRPGKLPLSSPDAMLPALGEDPSGLDSCIGMESACLAACKSHGRIRAGSGMGQQKIIP